MKLLQKIRILGWASISIGAIAALLCIYPSSRALLAALPIGFIGMICSSMYVYIDTKNDINSKKVTPGIIGLLLSSAPVLLILSFMIINFFNR